MRAGPELWINPNVQTTGAIQMILSKGIPGYPSINYELGLEIDNTQFGGPAAANSVETLETTDAPGSRRGSLSRRMICPSRRT